MTTTARRIADRPPAPRPRRPPDYRAYALIFAVCLWGISIHTLSTPGRVDRYGQLKGTDFAAFIVQGSFVAHGPLEEMYDVGAWKARLQTIAPELPNLLYIPVYPPQVGLLFAPFASMPYFPALALWAAISVALCLLALRITMRATPQFSPRFRDVALVLAAAPAFNQLLLHGQIAPLVLLCLAGGLTAYARGRDLQAGLWLGSLVFKPQYAALAALLLCAAREWRIVGWMIAAATAQMAATLLWAGPDVIQLFLESVAANLDRAYLFEPRPWTQHGLRNALVLLVGQGAAAEALYLLGTAVAVAAVGWRWRAITDRRLRAALLGLVVVLLNPHVFAYELVTLAPSLLLLAGWVFVNRERPEAIRLERLMVAVIVLPLFGPIAAYTRVQLSVAALAALAVMVWRAGAASGPSTAGP